MADEFGLWIGELAVEEDHVHMFLEFPPRYSIVRVLGILKSISASRTFQQFPWLRGSIAPPSCRRMGTPSALSATK